MFCIPVTRNLPGVLFRQNWIEDGLVSQTRWKRSEVAFANQVKFFLSHWSKENGRVFHAPKLLRCLTTWYRQGQLNVVNVPFGGELDRVAS